MSGARFITRVFTRVISLVISLAALIALALAGLVSAGPASAQAPARRVCDPSNSKTVSIAALAANPSAYMGMCVRVEAIYSNERLYADGDAIYGLNPHVIGGYVDGQGDLTGFWRGVFTGRVADCAKAEDDLLTGLLRSPGISLNYRTLGCLTPEGPFLLFMSQGELKPSGLVRRLPGEKGANLSPARDDWEHRASVAAQAASFLAALSAGDRQGLKAFVRNEYVIDQMIAGEDSAIEVLRSTPPELGQDQKKGRFEIFLREPQAPDVFSSEACYCLVADCAKRWPIAQRDADNQKERPYACLRIDGERANGTWTYSLDASRDFDGLPEPRQILRPRPR